MIASCATPCRPDRSRQPRHPRSSFRGCRLPATIQCILLRSTGRASSMSISAPPPIPARSRTDAEVAGDLTLHRAGDARRHLALRREQDGSTSLRPSASPPGCATARDSPSMPMADLCDPAWPRPVARELAETLRPCKAANQPAEELVRLERAPTTAGRNAISTFQKKLVLAPEYGGDGGKEVGACAKKREPVAVFPAHWAPNDLAIYEGLVPGCLSRRRVHRVPRLLESRAIPARGI